MPFCEKCGVELEERVRACPLCGTPVAGAHAVAGEPEVRASPGHDRRKAFLVMEATSVIAGIAALLCLGIDLWSSGGRLAWSLYVLCGLVMAWLPISMPIVFRNKPWLVLAVLAPAELLLIFFLNLLGVAGGGGWWFLSYALPVYLLSIGTTIAAAVLIAVSKVKGLNIGGILLAGSAIECLGLETILDLAEGGGLSLTWSPVVALACVPAAGLAFYFHYRIMKKPLARKLHV